MTPTRPSLKASIGAALRAERERRHISLDAVARGTLVRQDFLEMIDHDRLEELPTGAYAKGFIRSYVAYLGLDPKPFLNAYETRCGRPEPELSPLVQRGVRVPPARQKRAWQIAFGFVSVLAVVLGLFGAFRSGDESTELPTSVQAASRVRTSTAPSTMSTIVRIEVLDDESWVEAIVDGQPAFGNVLRRGEYETFKGTEDVELFVARGQTVRMIANGRILETPEEGEYRGVFTRTTELLPQNIYADAAETAEDASASTADAN
ncbi:MAG: RodZ domain-containing protein [Actinomycetota bacterium]